MLPTREFHRWAARPPLIESKNVLIISTIAGAHAHGTSRHSVRAAPPPETDPRGCGGRWGSSGQTVQADARDWGMRCSLPPPQIGPSQSVMAWGPCWYGSSSSSRVAIAPLENAGGLQT